MRQSLYRLFICLNILSVTRQQVLFTTGNYSEDTIMDSIRPRLTDIATNSMETDWLNIQEDFDRYIQKVTARWNELSDRASRLQHSFNTQFGAPTQRRCPSDVNAGFVLYGGFCYLFILEHQDWHTAKSKCIEMNAFLARPDTLEKDTYLEERAASIGQVHWIGASDLNAEGVWKWTDNDDAITFSNWSPNQPNDWGSGQDCLSLGFGAGGRHAWNDETCGNSMPYICQTQALEL